MTEFGGWSMPIQYASIVEEHRAVRERAGLFDVSHMGRLEFHGADVLPWLERSLSQQVDRLAIGQVQYSLLLNREGGVIDDVLVYRTDDGYAMVCNASNRERVIAELQERLGALAAGLVDKTEETAMIAVQGPRATALIGALAKPSETALSLKYYGAARVRVAKADCEVLISRTGYTGEDGFELVAPADRGVAVWEAILDSGANLGERVAACGLGARDTLRLEAAMPLHGHEISEMINPYSAGLGWAVKLDKGDFIGREALTRLRSEPGHVRAGLISRGKRIPRHGFSISRDGRTVGVVTSGTYSPTLEKNIALALVEPSAASLGTELEIDIRGNAEPAEVVPIPFYRRPRPRV